ncbi:MAG: Na/Pi cotransporter family protein [Breznakibacter sp.]|nr:Na/Pi cotransporter family protein [Breznakibacter sp.]
MDYSFLDFLRLIGSLGLFLYGMKMMSEALQKVAGSKMRSILSAMTSNRFLGLFTGFLVTSIIQSSSATTVMIVSFVNAGLMTLSESIGVIMGANIGTTVTGWIISILGFKVNISAYALPLIGIGLPLIFSQKNIRRSWGEFLLGFAMLFMGLDFLKGSVPDINSSPEIFAFLQNYSNMGYGSIFLFLFIGTILTIVIQSSSATMALTFVMCNEGWIPFEAAAAMVMGENIGTTVTANIAAAVGNISARRTALVHVLFNVLGVAWLLALFYPFVNLVDLITTNQNGISPLTKEGITIIPMALALFHTMFNITNSIVWIGFTPLFEKMVLKILPNKETEEEEFHLKFITTGMLSTAELSIIQARNEVQFFAKHTKKMFGFVRKLMSEDNDSKFNKLFSRIEKYENISDKVEVEIANYLAQVSHDKLSDLGKERSRAMIKLISDLESIGDSNYNLARTISRMRDNKITFDGAILEKLFLMFDMVDEAMTIMKENLNSEEEIINLDKANQLETQINRYRDKLKIEHLENLKNGVYTVEAGIIFNDMFQECEKLGDYIINVSEALAEIKID